MSDFIKAERKRSWKGSTAAKWTSSETFKEQYDRIFGGKCIKCNLQGAVDSALLHLDAITTGANIHRLAQIKQVLGMRECSTCEDAIKRAITEVNIGTQD
jgi:hypothetical protein